VSSRSNALEEERSMSTAPPRAARTAARIVTALVVLYAAGLVFAWALFRLVGERWWVTGAVLYLPMAGFLLPLPVLAALAWLVRRPYLYGALAAAAVVGVVGLMGFVVPLPHFGGHGPAVRVMSYNVDSQRKGVDAIVAEVDRFKPDVAAFVEVMASGLEAPLHERYPTVVSSGQILLATRYPVLSTRDPERVPYYGRQRSPRYIEHVLDTPLGHVALYVVHPISPREDLGAIRGRHGLKEEILSGRLLHPAGAEIVQVNSGLRRKQVEQFSDEASHESIPVIVAGDTNLPVGSEIFASNLSRFQDGFREAGWGFGYTYPNERRFAWLRLDRILASGELRFVDFSVGDSKSSDHRSIVADLVAR
jgi:endonuclease/exonuclease/phosphatase (EEP) superfamily protein YafD